MTPLEHWRLADTIMTNVESAKDKHISSIVIESMVNEAKTHAVLAAAGFSLLGTLSHPEAIDMSSDIVRDLFTKIKEST